MNRKRILFATDIPFWNRSTGAEQRIYELTRFLASKEFVVHIFYIGIWDEANIAAAAKLSGIVIEPASSDVPPDDLIKRVQWYASATLNSIQQFAKQFGLVSSVEPENQRSLLELNDFRWPWAIDRFTESTKNFRPDVIVIEYVKLAYLLEGLSDSQRSSTILAIDTHDVLSERCSQFQEQGYPHWIKINQAEELNELAKFDVIMAIQEQEAALFRKHIPTANTIVVGHAISSSHLIPRVSPQADELVIGYFGSNNSSNSDAVGKFISSAWQTVCLQNQKVQKQCKLMVAGSVCDSLNELPRQYLDAVELVRDLESVERFYEQVDLVINPVEFGTGLKIKNCEALAMGRPLLTTVAGSAGMPTDSEDTVRIAKNQQEMADHIIAASQMPLDDSLFQRCVQQAKSAFSSGQAYSELESSFQRPTKS